jgi:hypothetical protein
LIVTSAIRPKQTKKHIGLNGLNSQKSGNLNG